MTTIELEAENRELKRKLRDAELRAQAYKEMLAEAGNEALRVIGCARRPVDRTVQSLKFRTETYIGRVLHPNTGSGSRVLDSITEALTGDAKEGVVTLEDLQFVPRELISSIAGVGPWTMEALDGAMAEHGLTWADETPMGGRSAEVHEFPVSVAAAA